jgi:hypothetical protein
MAYRLKRIRKLEALGLKVVVELAPSVSEAFSFSEEGSYIGITTEMCAPGE